MNIKAILFDLDGTLLPMDQELFTKAYFKGISERVRPLGYEPEMLISTIWAGTAAMVKNDGSITNEEAFWRVFTGRYGDASLKDVPAFDEYYTTDFQKVKDVCGYQPMAKEIIQMLKEHGIRIILATNPIFPKVATYSRIRWVGLDPEDFELITTYENSSHCKPNPDYYRDILTAADLTPQECLMVGNDVEEDMTASKLGIETFLLTDCLINKYDRDISEYSHGDFAELMAYIGGMIG